MEGCSSTIVYLSEEEDDAQETKRLVEEKGGKLWLQTTNLKESRNCKEVVEKAIKDMGRINILVNNHGYQMMKKDISDLSEYVQCLITRLETDFTDTTIHREQWEHTFQTNIHPFFYLSKYVLPQMKSGDTIINCASINAYIGRPDLLDYTSTKGAIVSFTRGLSNQVVSKGIRVNAVCPGPVWTPLIAATMDKEAQEQFTSPMGRPGQPAEIATNFVFLASKDSSFISGQSLHPNGGTIING
jgi:NAD(P)-dependent dehydrogenase (short-subunit alcohol dehydrogenase family)